MESPLYFTSENMNYLHSEMDRDRIEYRRDRVMELYSEGRNRATIAKTLHLTRSTVHRDMHYRMQQTKDKVRNFIDERLPFEHEVCRVGLNKILEKTWDIINNGSDDKTKLLALALAKDCYIRRMELLDSKVEIDQIIQLVDQYNEKQRQIVLSATNPQFETESDYALSQRKF